MTERTVYRTQKGVLYRVCRRPDGYSVCFRPPCPAVWFPCVGMGLFSSSRDAEAALDALAQSQGWVAIGSTVPDPTGHWRNVNNKEVE